MSASQDSSLLPGGLGFQDQAAQPFDLEELRALVEGQIRACRAIRTASEAVEAAMGPPLDLGALEDAISTRASEMLALERLEARAQALRFEGFVPDRELIDRLTVLSECARHVTQADKQAREFARRAMEELRSEVCAVNKGRQGLRGYWGPARQAPRFADRKG